MVYLVSNIIGKKLHKAWCVETFSKLQNLISRKVIIGFKMKIYRTKAQSENILTINKHTYILTTRETRVY